MLEIFAYIDPGSGSLIFQLLLTGMLGTLFFFRRMLSAPFKWIYKKMKKPKEKSQDHEF